MKMEYKRSKWLCRITCSWRPIKKNTLGLRNSKTLEQLWVAYGEFNNLYVFGEMGGRKVQLKRKMHISHLFDFFDLLVKSTDHVIGGVGDFFNPHKGNKGINLEGNKGTDKEVFNKGLLLVILPLMGEFYG